MDPKLNQPKPIDFDNLDSVQEVVQAIVKSPDPKNTAMKLLGSGGFPKLYEAVNKFLEENIESIQIPPESWGRLTSIFTQGLFERNGGPLAKKRPLETAAVASQYVTVYLKAGVSLDTEQIIELEKLVGCDLGFSSSALGDLVNVFSAATEILDKTKEYIGTENIAEVSEPQAEAAADAEAGKKETDRVDQWLETMQAFGKPADIAWADGNLLYSYNTMIAKRLGPKLYLNETKYSNTTSKLMNHIKAAAEAMGLQITMLGEAFFGTTMEKKLPFAGADENEAAEGAVTANNLAPSAEDLADYAINVEHLYNTLESCQSHIDFEDLASQTIDDYNQANEAFPDRQYRGDSHDVAQALREVKSDDEPEEEIIEVEELDPDVEAEVDAILLAMEEKPNGITHCEKCGALIAHDIPNKDHPLCDVCAWKDGKLHEEEKTESATAVTAMSVDECMDIIRKVAKRAVAEGLIDDQESANFDAAEALYLWLSHNHGGMNTEEYSLLSSMLQPNMFKPRHDLNDVEDLEEAGQFLYNDMENILPEILGQEIEEEPAAEEAPAEEPPPEEPPPEEPPPEEPPTESAVEAALLERLMELSLKQVRAAQAGDQRKADRYETLIGKLIEENETVFASDDDDDDETEEEVEERMDREVEEVQRLMAEDVPGTVDWNVTEEGEVQLLDKDDKVLKVISPDDLTGYYNRMEGVEFFPEEE